MDAKDLKETLNLPRTDMPMRAGLAQREPEILEEWRKMGLDALIGEARRGARAFVLHDGPPYTNGRIHIGHLLNKTLKDVTNKYQTMKGRWTPYIPGWDTHGLPIERAVLTAMGDPAEPPDAVTLRRACRAYAREVIAQMTGDFQRLGVRADWEHSYATLDPGYEALEVRVFGTMFEKGLITKDFKSVNWCPECRTALAEAEIEYREITSKSLYVAFPVVADHGPLKAGDRIVAWTTTAWTLPANRAVCLNPDLVYVRAEGQDGTVIVAEEAYARLAGDLGLGPVLGRFQGREAEGAALSHPLFERTVPVILGEHVSGDEGTGAVHTAPGHGEEDFEVGRRYGLEVAVPVDGAGFFTAEAGPFAGLSIDRAYEAITAALRSRHRLVHEAPIRHQYPHCWRSKGPIIFRATEQWFCSISTLRADLIAAIRSVDWVPAWGAARLERMTEDRGEWCISRQRVWGVPIPALYCEGCGEIVVTQASEVIARRFEEDGSDTWWQDEAATFLPAGFACPSCGKTAFRKETDTLDVWFDSGSSHWAVLKGRGLPWPADLYIEGSDQFRGWFNSSLTTSVAASGHPPYRQVLSHGFITDELGDKMSKSRGNVISPSDLMAKYGADILRLWSVSSDYTADVSVSFPILDQVAESYRKIRNTLRFVVSNLYDFDADTPLPAELPPIEGALLSRLRDLVADVEAAYREYALHRVYHELVAFCAVDLSREYLDQRKDLLYTARPDDPERRAAQKVLEVTGRAILAMVAPVLTFSAEDIWGYFPHRTGDPATVQLLAFPEASEIPEERASRELLSALEPLRQSALKALEEARSAKVVGGSLEAALRIEAGPDVMRVVAGHRDLLATLCIVSSVEIVGREEPGFALRVARADGEKCMRCWRVLPDVRPRPDRPAVCDRCQAVLEDL